MSQALSELRQVIGAIRDPESNPPLAEALRRTVVGGRLMMLERFMFVHHEVASMKPEFMAQAKELGANDEELTAFEAKFDDTVRFIESDRARQAAKR